LIVQKIADPLTDLLRNGAKELIAQAVKAELERGKAGIIAIDLRKKRFLNSRFPV
jgi:hypothetical protein